MTYTDDEQYQGEGEVGQEFMDWLAKQAEGDDAPFESYRDMSRRTGVSVSTLHRLRHGEQRPTLKQLKILSNSLHIDLIDLQRMAGILPNDPQLSPDENKRQMRIRQLLGVFARLPEKDQGELMAVATAMLSLSDNNKALLVSMAKTMAEQEAAMQ